MDVLTLCAISFSILVSASSDTEPLPCDLNDVNSTCPDGYCCVRDSYFFSLTTCKPFGKDGDACVTKPSSFECPCARNYYCKSNLAQGHIISHFGKCRLPDNYTTEATPMQLNEESSTDKPAV